MKEKITISGDEISKAPNVKQLLYGNNGHLSTVLHEDYDLKVTCKKLPSGRCQVKFFATKKATNNIYGYTLVEPETTLKEVVRAIKIKLRETQKADIYYHSHLYDLGKKQNNKSIFMIFKSESGEARV